MAFSERFSTLLKERGVSRYRLSKLAHLSPSYVGYLASGERSPSDEVLGKISGVLGISFEELKSWELEDSLGTDGLARLQKYGISNPAPLTELQPQLHEVLDSEPISEISDSGHTVNAKTQDQQSPKPSESEAYGVVTNVDSICNEKQTIGHKDDKLIGLTQIPLVYTGKLLPVYGVDACGVFPMTDQKPLYFIEVPDIIADNSDCAVVSDGKSLFGYRNGDYVALKLLENEEPFDDEDVVVWTEGKGASHRVYHHDDRGGYLEGFQGSGDPWRSEITPGVRIVGAETARINGRRCKRVECP